MDQGEVVLDDGRGLTLRAEPRGNVGLVMVFEPRAGEIRFVHLVPLSVPEDRLPEFALALARVNARLGIGAFHLREGAEGLTAAFSIHAYLNHDGTISDLVVDRCVHACRATVEQFLPELFPGDAATGSR